MTCIIQKIAVNIQVPSKYLVQHWVKDAGLPEVDGFTRVFGSSTSIGCR